MSYFNLGNVTVFSLNHHVDVSQKCLLKSTKGIFFSNLYFYFCIHYSNIYLIISCKYCFIF